MVARGNPLNVPSDLHAILNPDYRTVLGAPDSSSIGRETKKILDQAGIYDQAIEKTLYLTSDSKDLDASIADNKADLIINWRATGMWEKNKDVMDILLLDKKTALPNKLILGLLSFSSQPEIARSFMELASGAEGQDIFARYGFGE